MPSIQDYFNDRFLQHMQETLSTVVGMPVRAEFVELEEGRNFLQFRPDEE